jgi:ribosomal protein S18 acetylase RimI-like enzyme
MAEWQIGRLERSHERAAFCCGKAPLDDFLRALVSQYEKRKLGRTYVATRPGEKQVLGYYTLASAAIAFPALPPAAAKKLPKHPVPAVLLARLAVDASTQGQGLGEELLLDALHRSLALSAQLGIHAVVVDAIDEQAKAWYLKYGFLPLLDDPMHLYLPIGSIEDGFTEPERKR